MRFAHLLALPVTALVFTACNGGDLQLPPGGPGVQVQLVDGNGQSGDPGAALGNPLVVRVVDEEGTGVPGRIVSWVISEGGGSTSPQRSATDDNGQAQAQWTLGPAPGTNTLAATVDGVGSVDFTATARGAGGTPSASQSELTSDQNSIPADAGTATITVVVRDDAGAPVEGATVALQATGDGNTITQPAQSTGADGTVTGTLQSHVPGTKTISATVNGSVTLDATAQIQVTGAPTGTRIELSEGDGQSAPAGAAVAVRPAVRVLDGQGQPVAGVAVTFVVTAGAGQVGGANQVTSADGIARVDSWTLGATPGTNTLEARAPTAQGSPIVFTAEGTSSGSGVDHLVFVTQPPSNVSKDKSFTVRVAMADASGTTVPLSGITLYVALFEEGDEDGISRNKHIEGNRFEPTHDGVAEFHIGIDKPGSWRLRALSDELPGFGPDGSKPHVFSDPFTVSK
ncbi:MAG: Ig-like domain-containing protein [Gemmatimonadales bacterium]